MITLIEYSISASEQIAFRSWYTGRILYDWESKYTVSVGLSQNSELKILKSTSTPGWHVHRSLRYFQKYLLHPKYFKKIRNIFAWNVIFHINVVVKHFFIGLIVWRGACLFSLILRIRNVFFFNPGQYITLQYAAIYIFV